MNPFIRHLPWLICFYFFVQIVIRVLISPSLGKDEAEQVLLSQALEWGYGPQPPLYTWLTICLFAVFGKGIFVLALLKNLLLAGTYLLTYAIARSVGTDRLVAAAAAASLLLLPEIAWESQRALTHSVLVLFAVALFTYAMVGLQGHGGEPGQGRGRWSLYALLGVAFAAGVLAKFNFPIIAVAMFLAALSMPAFRPRILDWRSVFSAAVAALLLWRPLEWILDNRVATMQRAEKLAVAASDNLLANYAAGVWELVLRSFLFLAPLLLLYGVLMIGSARYRAADSREHDFVAFITRAISLAFAACLALVILFEVTKLKGRWLLPLLYGAPLVVVIWCSWRLPPRRLKVALAVSAFCAVLIVVMLPVRTVVAPMFGRTNPLNEPYKTLAAQIRTAGFQKGGILASYNLLGGNLHLQFPDSTVVTPEYPNFALPKSGPYLLVWAAGSREPPPEKLVSLFARATGRALPPLQPHYLVADRYFTKNAPMRIGVAVLP